MADLDNLKLDAEALGIKYRADIKGETLQKKIDEHNKEHNPSAVVEVVTTVEPIYQPYKNTSKSLNVFTEAGKCAPGRTVELTSDEAKKYAGLELCQK